MEQPMYFIVKAMDKPDSHELRQATRPKHLDYIHGDKAVRLGGPFLDAEGRMIGSMVILEAADRAAAEAWAANDPYKKAGLFTSVEITPWKPTVNSCGAEI
jgi:uncharacterized protein YciI